MSSRIVPAKVLATEEDGLRVRNKVTALLESSPDPAGWKVSLIIQRGKLQTRIDLNGRLSIHSPLLAQNTPVLLVLGADDDIFAVLLHTHVVKDGGSVGEGYLEGMVSTARLEGMVDVIVPEDDDDAVEEEGTSAHL